MILYFSATGNSEYAAKRIGKETGDRVMSLFEKIRNNDFSEMSSDRPWIIVTPTYAWRIPHIVEKWIRNTGLSGSSDVYFVMTCGGNIGNAGKYLQKLCSDKNMNCRGCMEIVMPENYIAMFSVPSKEKALEIIDRAESVIDRAALLVKNGESFPQSKPNLADKISSSAVNKAFYPIFVHSKKFYVGEGCVSCGKCAEVCPLGNVVISNGKPVWGDNCTHCMACICRCPKQAVEYGRHSKNQVRYVCPKQA